MLILSGSSLIDADASDDGPWVFGCVSVCQLEVKSDGNLSDFKNKEIQMNSVVRRDVRCVERILLKEFSHFPFPSEPLNLVLNLL